MDASALASAESWLSVIAVAKIVAAALVAAGVVVEFATEWVGRPFERIVAEAGRQETARANAKAAEANERAAKLENEAAAARLEAQNLKKQLSWREVTPKQSEIIRSALINAPMQITISWVAGDPEGSAFSQQLAEAFTRSGMEISAFAPMGFLGQEPHGLSISGSERSEVEALASALDEAGLGRPSVDLNARKPDGTKYFTHLQVGYRTPPTLNP
jgi:hypothetical protein